MTPDEKMLKKALADFPKIVKQKRDAAKHREKILKAFAPLSRKLLKRFLAESKKSTPSAGNETATVPLKTKKSTA